MNIIELEINDICECRHALLKFPSNIHNTPLYLVHSNEKCEIITFALQLICGVKYTSSAALQEIRDKICNGQVKITFSLLRQKKNAGQSFQQQDHSSDSDVPCTSRQARQRLERRLAKRRQVERSASNLDHSSDSDIPCSSRQARERLERRLKRRRQIARQTNTVVITACRNFTTNPDLIAYTVDGGPIMECSVMVFQIRFFTCTDIIFPRLTDITHGEYCNGRWLDLLSTGFIDRGTIGKNKLLEKFCKLYGKREIDKNHILSELTTSVLTGRIFLNNSRISHLINIFNDIRWLFEYITCSEYTVWFLLPSVFGNLQDISKITTENTNFDLLKTEIQLKKSNATPLPWTQADKHVQELLLVAVQLAFGHHCQQNIIYLHSLNYLEKHQSFEYLNYSLVQSSSTRQLLFEKNFFNRIFNVCAKLNICCVLECCGGLHSYLNQGFIIKCCWNDSSKEWKIGVKSYSLTAEINSDIAHNFLEQLENNLK